MKATEHFRHSAKGALLGAFFFAAPAIVLAQGWEASAHLGNLLDIDPYLSVVRHRSNAFSLAYLFSTRHDTTGYAQDFGFPTFSMGVGVCDYTRVLLNYPGVTTGKPSPMGMSYILYAAFTRTLLGHQTGWSLDYSLENGLSYNTRIWNRSERMKNELIGSHMTLYFGVAFHLAYRHGPWEWRIGPKYHHLSNGALARPNKGANRIGLDLAARYYLNAPDNNSTTPSPDPKPFTDKGLFLRLSYHTGLKTSIGQWLVNRRAMEAGQPLSYDHYTLYVCHSLSSALMYRYARRFASGIGMDLLYEPYLGRIEAQNPDRPRSVQKWSLGLAAHHQVFYRRWSANFSLGYYLSRPFKRYAITDEEYGYYERIGISYRLPIASGALSAGYRILAHRTKAYASELALDWDLPFRKHSH